MAPFHAETYLVLCPGCLPFQCTLLPAGLLVFARTLPCPRMFSGSLLSTKVRYKCTSLAILSFCDLAITKIFSLLIYFYPSTVSSQNGYQYIAPAASWCAAVLGVTKSQTKLSSWTELNWCYPNVPSACSRSCCFLWNFFVCPLNLLEFYLVF